MQKGLYKALYCATALTTLTVFAPQTAFAQKLAAADAAADTGEITVTARHREESIVDVPLAIAVVTSKTLDKLDITSTEKLANYVPGLQFSDFTPGYSRNDRGGTRPLIFRGLNTGTGGSVTAAGGMFLDGAAVVGNEIPGGMDIGAVEILRGPQSVYFGRSTMTGAVSYRTKAIPQDWQAQVDVTVAERSTRKIEASVAGPIVPGKLGVRLTGLSESSGGYVTNTYNNSSSKLGDRSRNSISGTVEFTPVDSLEIKGYVNYFRDVDGASATAFLNSTNDNCIAPNATRHTICGVIPDKSHSINYHNTTIPTQFAASIFASPLLNGTGFKDQIGLQREVVNSHLVANYDINDYLKFQSITGYHTNVTLQASDGIAQPVLPTYAYNQYFYTITNKARDFSQEFRLSSDPKRAFSWTVGTNYVNASNKVQAIVAFLDQVGGVPTTYRPIPQNLGTDGAKTYGFFGGGYYKLLDDRLTLSAEARYQIDKRHNQQVSGVTGLELNNPSGTFKSFNPRVSIDYDVGEGRKIYASYASGTRPGGFNAVLQTYLNRNDPILTAQLNQYLGATNFTYAEEKLRIGELGFKGNFAGGKGYFDINTYYGKLSDQQVAFGSLIPYLGFTVTAISNIGQTTVYGAEWQGNYNFTNEFSLATTFAWNHAERNKYTNTAGIPQFGTTNLDGVKMANAPEISGSAVLSYTHEMSNAWNIFTNVAYVYRGKQFTDAGNLSWIKGRSQVDLRGGLSNDSYMVELFMTNVFNDQNYTAGNVAADFGGAPPYYGFFGAWAPPRTVGARISVKF